MTIEKFEKILLQSESSNLDFKRGQYDFSNDKDEIKTSKFVKDIISFSNTIRTDTGYIILGIAIEEDGSKELLGINMHIDDAIFQEKIKNKVLPVPKFSYSTLTYQNKIFGIIEIPVTKYEYPISPITKLKGLEPGKFYFRRGSSNSEANGYEGIQIANWLSSLSDIDSKKFLFSEIHELVIKITESKLLLSVILSDALLLSRKYYLRDLQEFCSAELTGLNVRFEESNKSVYSYRTNSVLFTYQKFDFPPYWDPNKMMKLLEKEKGVFRFQLFFHQSIIEIEETLNKFSKKPMLCTINVPGDTIISDEKYKALEITIYADKDNFDNLYMNIKQKLIDKLLEINI
ncbi:ATP-binding protein [Flavobacterium zepuense]|uniref:ATP-binding protein n=1 Tax=Flavobacterium zepuense TaxID=2593302 RepID=A0A552V1C0_9FLAO|nr:RNA-binding domain-containing protein [Flavobacterium zepuense]TRW24254.1 ATP-binding protein [Flavobacterium zepuense]